MTDILNEAKSSLTVARRLPYPKGLTVSGWWQEMQSHNYAISTAFTTVDEVIRMAQMGETSGFDHREFDSAQAGRTIRFKLAELALRFPGFDISRYPEESGHSAAESIVSIDGRRLSSILLTHLYFYLQTTALPKVRHRILEIGSGYGGLARIYKTMQPGLTYILTDLPESLFFANVFLRANFPDAKTWYAHEALPPNIDEYDFVFVPAQQCKLLQGLSIDLTINTGSLQEMTASAAYFWMKFIQQTVETRFFFSWNYFLNAKAEFKETKADHCLIAPILDAYWKVRHFRINDPITTIDANQRNWLEVLVERMPPEQRAGLDRLIYTNNLITRANQYPTASNYWFAHIWMAIWSSPAPALIDSMLMGIDYVADRKAFGITSNLIIRKFDECEFYLALRDSLT